MSPEKPLNAKEVKFAPSNRAVAIYRMGIQSSSVPSIQNIIVGCLSSDRVLGHVNFFLFQIMDKGSEMIDFVKDRPGHDRRYAIDSETIRRLGWKPRHNFDEALKETVKHYLKNYQMYIS